MQFTKYFAVLLVVAVAGVNLSPLPGGHTKGSHDDQDHTDHSSKYVGPLAVLGLDKKVDKQVQEDVKQSDKLTEEKVTLMDSIKKGLETVEKTIEILHHQNKDDENTQKHNGEHDVTKQIEESSKQTQEEDNKQIVVENSKTKESVQIEITSEIGGKKVKTQEDIKTESQQKEEDHSGGCSKDPHDGACTKVKETEKTIIRIPIEKDTHGQEEENEKITEKHEEVIKHQQQEEESDSHTKDVVKQEIEKEAIKQGEQVIKDAVKDIKIIAESTLVQQQDRNVRLQGGNHKDTSVYNIPGKSNLGVKGIKN